MSFMEKGPEFDSKTKELFEKLNGGDFDESGEPKTAEELEQELQEKIDNYKNPEFEA